MLISLRGGGRGWFVALMIGWLAVACASDHRATVAPKVVTTAAPKVVVPKTQHKLRLRHSRHLDGFMPTRKASASTVAPYLAVKDNHKPIFTKCNQQSMKEDLAIGTNIFKVEAYDVDPVDQGGKVSYKLINNPGEKDRFRVDPETGEVYTNALFDRDEPSREKEVYITVRATDNGHPQLDDACTIKIVVEDINDNPPVFDKVMYSESVPQDLPPFHEVMRISATDIDDGNNSIVHYALGTDSPDAAYFYIDPDTGVIFLNKSIDKPPGFKFRLSAVVKDMGIKPLQSWITLDILVVESNKKSPSFIEVPSGPIKLKENYSDFTKPIATIRAVSNIPEETKLQFELVQGQTEQTNKWHTFVLEPDAESAYIKLGNHLDYEKITEYTLTVRIQNNYKLAAETIVLINVSDVNDNIPIFVETRTGMVLENEPPGTHVMVVKAIDYDGTSDNNQITYSLEEDSEPQFAIDPITGNITTLKVFDRETKSSYNLKVTATDNSESALIPGKHNQGQQVILIEIADKNDNPPHFTQDTYVAESIAENANINELVTQVSAVDNDTASIVSYDIVSGNTYDAFVIKNITGEIRVNSPLDYENITTYNLDVRAFDGIFEDYCKVIINIENLNDNRPVFLDVYNKTIEEERLYDGCVVRVEAYDPDIRDRSKPQMIKYSLVKQEQEEFLSIDDTGCLRLTKPLDRDQPSGFVRWQILIIAVDHGGGADSLRSTTEVILELTDINDNAPFLTNTQPVIVYENGSPGKIATLTAKDYDSPKNGPPFIFALNDSASSDIRSKFRIDGNELIALVSFDREAQKQYRIPVLITDSGTPRMSGVSELTVVIGDRNDNAMSAGHSDIFVYVYKTKQYIAQLKEGKVADTEVGRVYVSDPDDWDLNDKLFNWYPSYDERVPYFDLQRHTGMIIMRGGTPNGTYHLTFNVTEENLPMIPWHWVKATVNVTIKEIPEEAVRKSGSVRFVNVTAEEFISSGNDAYFQGLSMKDKMHRRLALLFNTSLDNVDVFTVMNKNTVKDMYLDVRFSAHGSPYYEAEKLNTMVSGIQEKLEHDLGEKIYMVHIDECIIEKEQCEDSCTNVLKISDFPLAVFTNKTSFVGVNANTVAECACNLSIELTTDVICYNGGTPVSDKCECPEGLNGPHCEQTSVGFHGDGWAQYPPPPACAEAHISLTIMTANPNELIFYLGPIRYSELLPVDDFMSLELANGFPVLLVNYGSGVARIHHTMMSISDGEPHLIEILLAKNSLELFVDKCKLSSCMSLAAPVGNKEILNVNGPLQLGGANVDLRALGTSYNWRHVPSMQRFTGCISNFTYNDFTYNLGVPSYHKNADPSCVDPMSKAVAFSVTGNFLIVILVCAIVLVVLLVAVVVYRRRSDAWAEKELDDIRENIIAYEDEGGGEGDAGYDLQVLRSMYGTQPAGPEPPPFPRPPLPDRERPSFIDGCEEEVRNIDETTSEEHTAQPDVQIYSPPAMFADVSNNREDRSQERESLLQMVTFRNNQSEDTSQSISNETTIRSSPRPQSLRISLEELGIERESPGRERVERAMRTIEERVPLSPIVIIDNAQFQRLSTLNDNDMSKSSTPRKALNIRTSMSDDHLTEYSQTLRQPQVEIEEPLTEIIECNSTISRATLTENVLPIFPPVIMCAHSSTSNYVPIYTKYPPPTKSPPPQKLLEVPSLATVECNAIVSGAALSEKLMTKFPQTIKCTSPSTPNCVTSHEKYPPPTWLPQDEDEMPSSVIPDCNGTVSGAPFKENVLPIFPPVIHPSKSNCVQSHAQYPQPIRLARKELQMPSTVMTECNSVVSGPPHSEILSPPSNPKPTTLNCVPAHGVINEPRPPNHPRRVRFAEQTQVRLFDTPEEDSDFESECHLKTSECASESDTSDSASTTSKCPSASQAFANRSCHSIFPPCIRVAHSPTFPMQLMGGQVRGKQILCAGNTGFQPPHQECRSVTMRSYPHSLARQSVIFTGNPPREFPPTFITENPPREFVPTRHDLMLDLAHHVTFREGPPWAYGRPLFRDDHSPLLRSSAPQRLYNGLVNGDYRPQGATNRTVRLAPPDQVYYHRGVVGAAPDISGFLDDKKNVLDRDPDFTPLDDVRNYAFEGDGNTSGSLSSLASCTDDSDLTFHYLTSFGPRFRKLADLYGEDDDDRPEESWC